MFTDTISFSPSTLPSTYSPPPRAQQIPPRDADIIIVGGGVAGCSAAVAFGKQGRRVLLFEKSLKEPDRVSGELLQPGGVKALNRLGLGSECPDSHAWTGS